MVGIDAAEGRVAVEGWLETGEVTAPELAKRFEDAGVAAIVHTDIARDGMLEGPNLEATAALAESISIPVILSGGVRSEDDLLRAAAFAARGIAGCHGVAPEICSPPSTRSTTPLIQAASSVESR